MAALQTQKAISPPPEMMVALAINHAEAPAVIAARYGFTQAQYDDLCSYPDFQAELNKLRSTDAFERLMGMMGLEIAQRLFQKVFATDSDVPLSFQRDLMNDYFRYAKRDPKSNPQQQQATGPQFSITFKVGGQEVKVEAQNPTHAPQAEAEHAPLVIEGYGDATPAEEGAAGAPGGHQATPQDLAECLVEAPAPPPVVINSLDDLLKALDD